eukprot:4755404-Prymnesium_polylepis.1
MELSQRKTGGFRFTPDPPCTRRIGVALRSHRPTKKGQAWEKTATSPTRRREDCVCQAWNILGTVLAHNG